jgi:hypothetical protein
LNGASDCLKDTFGICEDIVVPKSQNVISQVCEPAISCCIGAEFEVLATVCFDNQFQFATYEIANVAINWLLANKFNSGDLPIA